jgi:hypothetical protein
MSESRKKARYHAESYPLPPGFGGRLAFPYRWFSGQPLNGHRYTDATGFHYGTKSMDPSGRATSYQLLPGYKRVLYFRLPITTSPALVAMAYVEPELTASTLTAASLYGFHKIGRAWERHVFRKEVVEPVAIGLSGVMRRGHVKGKGHQWVHVPVDLRDDPDAFVRVQLPLDWLADKGDKERLVDLIGARLHIEELTPSWHFERGRSWVDLKVPPKPVNLVTFQQAREDMEQADPAAPLMGYGPRGKLVTFDLSLESPHLLIAGGSGAGKSELIAAIVAQFMRAGFGIMVLDAKFTSHMWLRKVPGVLYASEAEELHDALIWLDEELLRRARFVASGGDPNTLVPLCAVLEEINGASNRLRAYWKTIKTSEDPMMSPALTALVNLSSMGREMCVHIIMAGQSVTAKASGGPENRENFGARTLARATAAQWRMLAPQIKPAPTKRGAPGRWHVVVGDSLREYQAVFMDLKGKKDPNAEADLIGWATAGQPVPDVVAMMLAGGGGGTRIDDLRMSEAVPPTGISLRQYADEAGLELRTLTRWRERRSDFPVESSMGANNTKLYERSVLRDYVRLRNREEQEQPSK